jgi:hypothetical protein
MAYLQFHLFHYYIYSETSSILNEDKNWFGKDSNPIPWGKKQQRLLSFIYSWNPVGFSGDAT